MAAQDLDDAPFDSSDYEFEPPPKLKTQQNIAQASIDKIIKAATEDRYNSKRTSKQLQYGHGVAGTQYLQQLWIVRFNTFRDKTLQKNVKTMPSENEILRFLDSIIGKLDTNLRGKDKPAVGLGIMISALQKLIDYCTFTYSEFKLSRHEGARIKTLLDDCVRTGRLTKGVWQKRVWISFMIMDRMTSGYLTYNLDNGCRNWDIVIARLMSVILISAFGCRAGEVSRSNHWKGLEYLRYEHIELEIKDGCEPSFENLTGHITLEYAKGHKDVRNDVQDIYLSPLKDPRFRHVCPITWLLVHALRHGLIAGVQGQQSNLQEVLRITAERSDKRVPWAHPRWPVCAAFNSGVERSQIHLTKPSNVHQPGESIKMMGLVSNILTRVYMHGTRIGHAGDVSHLPSKDGQGFISTEVRQALGHTTTSYNKGISETYAGNPIRELYNDRAENQHVLRYGAKFSEESALKAVKAPISAQDIAQYQRENEPDLVETQSKVALERARRRIRRQRHQLFLETAQPEAPLLAKEKGKALAERSASELNRQVPASMDAQTASMDLQTASMDSLPQDLNANIDPRLLGEEQYAETEVQDTDIEQLNSCLFPEETKDQDQEDAFEDAAIQTLLDDESVQMDANMFITKYSRINIVKNENFARAWQEIQAGKLDRLDVFGLTGNSRDVPTPFQFHCAKSEGCTYYSLRLDTLVEHERTCTPARVEKAANEQSKPHSYQCSEPDCDATFTTRKQLTTHITAVHKWEPKQCDVEDCEETKTFDTKWAFKAHMSRAHAGRYPTQCKFPGCTEEKPFNGTSTYSRHLRDAHNLTTTEEREPFFPSIPEKMFPVYVPTACTLEGCKSKTVFAESSHHKQHLVGVHSMTSDEASEVLKPFYEMVTETERSARKGAREDAKSKDTKAPKSKKSRL